jgi:hypothetical protein
MQGKVTIGAVSKAPFFDFDILAVWKDALLVRYGTKHYELSQSYFQLDRIECTLLKSKKQL